MPPQLPPPFIVGETYADRVGDYRVVSLEGNRVVVEYADGRRSAGSVEQKALIFRNILLEQKRRQPTLSDKSLSSRRRPEHCFTHDDVFPIIAEVIETESAKVKNYVSHGRIVNALLKHKEMEPIVASCLQVGSRTASWWVHCMVAWFSKIFTDGRSDWGARFERKKQNNKWAYKVASH